MPQSGNAIKSGRAFAPRRVGSRIEVAVPKRIFADAVRLFAKLRPLPAHLDGLMCACHASDQKRG